MPAITDKDWLDLQFGIDVGVDYYALSFVRSADVIYELKAYLAKQGTSKLHPGTIIKHHLSRGTFVLVRNESVPSCMCLQEPAGATDSEPQPDNTGQQQQLACTECIEMPHHNAF